MGGADDEAFMPPSIDPVVSLETLSETELAGLLRRGDAGAFRLIMQRNNRRLYRLARTVLRDESEAEDVLQEAYLRAFRARESFKGEASLATWLTQITLNEARGRLRRRRSAPAEEPSAAAAAADSANVVPFPQARGAAPVDGTDPEHAAAASEIRHLLQIAIDELPEKFRVVFVMREVEQMATSDVAACLGIPADTVKSRLHRAKKMLRTVLEGRLESALADAFPFGGWRCARVAQRVLEVLGLPPPDPAA
jgi:RNA polymerase sigma-70 factor (ECF subfamily)